MLWWCWQSFWSWHELDHHATSGIEGGRHHYVPAGNYNTVEPTWHEQMQHDMQLQHDQMNRSNRHEPICTYVVTTRSTDLFYSRLINEFNYNRVYQDKFNTSSIWLMWGAANVYQDKGHSTHTQLHLTPAGWAACTKTDLRCVLL